MIPDGGDSAFTRAWAKILEWMAAMGPCSSPWAFLDLPAEEDGSLLITRMYSATTSVM
jgi:hypothetical protein